MQSISTIGLDIAKSVFQVHGVDAAGQVVLRRQLRRRQLLALSPEAAAIPGGYRGVRLIAHFGLAIRSESLTRSCLADSQRGAIKIQT
jgi:hypothetical protein